ncbi:MAG TPA: DUF1552 domain-containing protein [Polyangiaceae bacterium]|jgi:hypothetical protein|nr:DUF1552 domain-containing protein [Polyangiaceae bacterium]
MRRALIGRRSLLTGAGAALALPYLDIMRARAASSCDADAPKRLIVMYTPNGTIPAAFWPTGSEDDFELSPILSPLEAHKSDLLIVGGMDILSGNTGPGDPHQRGTGSCLTGRALMEGNFSGDANEVAGWASGISLDQQVAASIDCTPLRSLEFGVMVEDPTVRGRISYTGAGKPLPPENSPSKIYERVFEPGLSKEEKALRRERRGYVIDRVLDQYKALNLRLGSEDRTRLESHVEALTQLETQLAAPGVEFGGACVEQDVPTFSTDFDYSQLPAVGKAQIDVLTQMVRCDVTRVATLMWTHSQSQANYPLNVKFGGQTFTSTGGHHGLAHKGDDEAEYIAKNTAIDNFFASQLAYLIDQLKAIPEGEGTAFDNTLILWTNEQNKGNTHDMGDMPYVLAGSAGGAIQTGRYKRFGPELSTRNGERGESHNRLLTTVLKAMGLPDESFGDPNYASDVLPGILS